jgi:hypothetical protein
MVPITLALLLTTATAATPMRVGGEVTAPVAVYRVEPKYDQCTGKKMTGFPILEAVIDEKGHVRNLRFLKPVHPCVKASILPALSQWRFKPATYRGKAVPVKYNLTILIHYR